jgi:hypothetical protein
MSSLLYRVSFVALLFFAVYVAPAQKIDSMMNVYRDKFPEEKIHVHFDKNYYNPGETIWFKAYVLSGINLSEISKNFYAELINDQVWFCKGRSTPAWLVRRRKLCCTAEFHRAVFTFPRFYNMDAEF